MSICDKLYTMWVTIHYLSDLVDNFLLCWLTFIQLQLGVRDVFHRYRADLSIMSPDARLFVKSIEQVVTIHVDKFPNTGKNSHKYTLIVTISKSYWYYDSTIMIIAYPVPEPLTDRYFLASHPFLYFVIDKESGVSLVAGIMNDPLKQTIRFL